MSRLTRTNPLRPIGIADQTEAEQRADALSADMGFFEANRLSLGAMIGGWSTNTAALDIAGSTFPADPNWELTDADLKGVTEGVDVDLWEKYESARSYEHLLYIYGQNQALMDRRKTLSDTGMKGFAGQLVGGFLDPGMAAVGAATGGSAPFIRGTGLAASAARVGFGAAAGGIPQAAVTLYQSTADPAITNKEVAKSFAGGALFGGVAVATAPLSRSTRFLSGAAGQALGPGAIDYATGTPASEAMLELGTNLLFGGVFNSLHSSASLRAAELPPDAPVAPKDPAGSPPPYDPYAGASELTRLLVKDDMQRLGITVDPNTAMKPSSGTSTLRPAESLEQILARPRRSAIDEVMENKVGDVKNATVATREEWTADLSARLDTALKGLPDLAAISRQEADATASAARAAADPITTLQEALGSDQFTDLQILMAREDVASLIRDEPTPSEIPAGAPKTAERVGLDELLDRPLARPQEQQPDGAAMLSELLGRTGPELTPAAIRKMSPKERKKLAKATVAAAASKPGGVDALVSAIEKEAAIKAIAANLDAVGRGITADAAVAAAAAEGRELTPAEKIRYAEAADDKKVEERITAALEGVGRATPSPAAAPEPAPIPQPETNLRAYRFTRNGLFDRLGQLWRESPAVRDAETQADIELSGQGENRIGSGDSPFVFKDEIPEEITQAFEGTRWMKHFRVAKPGEKAGGPDFLSDAGTDGLRRLLEQRYATQIDRWDADFRAKVMQWAKSGAHDNPEALFIAQLLDNLGDSKAKLFDKNVAFAAADDIQPGHEFKIGESIYRVIEDEDGAKLITDGEGFVPIDASALATIPYDRGTLRPIQIGDNPFGDLPDVSPLTAAELTKLEAVYPGEFGALVPPAEARRIIAELDATSPRVQAKDSKPPLPRNAEELNQVLTEGLSEGEAADIAKQVQQILAGKTESFNNLKAAAAKNPNGWQAREVAAVEAELAKHKEWLKEQVRDEAGDVGDPIGTETPPRSSFAQKLDAAADKVIANAKERKKQRAKDAAEARRKAKPGDRLGIDEITPNVVDNAMIVAAQAFKAGVRTVEKVRELIRELLGKDSPEVEARAMAVLAASTDADGKLNQALFDAEVAKVYATATESAGEKPAAKLANVSGERLYNLDAHSAMFGGAVPESINLTTDVTILGKNRRLSAWRYDIAGSLGKSKSPLMRLAGKMLALDFMPSKDGSPAVVSLHESVIHNVTAFEGEYESIVKPAWLKHRQEAKAAGVKPMNRVDFEIAVGKAFRRPETPSDPNIAAAKSGVRKMYDRLGQILKDHGLDVGLLDNYLNRLWVRPALDDAALRMARAGKTPDQFTEKDLVNGQAQLRERLADAILAKGKVDREEATRLAQTIIDHAGHSDGYDGDDGVTTGYSSRLKERIDLDETFRWKLADGSEMAIEDLIESNLYTLFKSYNRAAHGSAALAEASRMFSMAPDLGGDRVDGISQILNRIREDANAVGMTPKEYGEDLDRVREVLHMIAGLPSRTETGFDRATDAVRMFQNVRLMQNLGTGLIQMGELIGRMGELGPRVITNFVPALLEVIHQARKGQMSTQQAREIAQLGIAIDRTASRIPRRVGESLGHAVGRSAGEWNLRRAARAAFDLSWISFLTDASRLAVVRSKQQQWGSWAFSGHIPNKRRLAIDTLTPEMAGKIVAEIRKPGRAVWVDKPGGLLDRYVWERWPHDVRVAFQGALRRNASRSILSIPDSAMPMVANTPAGKVFFQFRRMMAAAQATIGPELYARDAQTVRTLAASAAGGALIYVANTYLQSIGRRDRKKYLDERLEPSMVLRAAFSRSLYSAYLPTAIDTIVSDIGRKDPVFSFARTTGLQGGFLLGNPTVDWFNRMGFPNDPLRVPRAMLAPGIPYYDFSKQDIRAIQGTFIPNIVGLKTAIDRWAESLPEKSFEE